MADIRLEFTLNQQDPERSRLIAEAFSDLLDTLDLIWKGDEERTIAITKLQEAHFHAQQALR